MLHVTKIEAIKRLFDLGHTNAAQVLCAWHDKNGKSWGWDGFFRGRWPELVDLVWKS